MHQIISFVVGALLIAGGLVWGQVESKPPKPPPEFKAGEPVQQPLPFSHKKHVGLDLECLDCHTIEDPGDFAGFPAEAKCMACHAAVKADSPHIQKLAEAEKTSTPIEWNRVYRMKEFVYFSHEIHHREAGVDCAACHGDVASRDVLFQERSVGMYACMKCHEQYKAPNNCEVCHDTH